jgi:ATP-binding cassette subfamily D (ALD) protein 4
MRHSFSSENEPILNNNDEHIEENKPNKAHYSFDGIFLRRFFRLLKILFKSSKSIKIWSTSKESRKNSLFWLYMTFIGLGISYEVLVYFVGMIPSQFYAILTSRDIIGFSKYILPCLLLVFATATVSVSFDPLKEKPFFINPFL